ncbi:MAG: hypothetical protein H6R07_2783 [Proteobacteria bacterium]|nr:hypothetical protein [Pseudomonadota bacterium]
MQRKMKTDSQSFVLRTCVTTATAVFILTGCAAVNNLGLNLSDTFAPKVTFRQPAKSADAAALRSVIIMSDGNNVSQQLSLELESSLSKLRIDERPYYSSVKLGPRSDGQTNTAQLNALARANGAEAIIFVSGGSSDVKTSHSTEERSTCDAKSKQLFKSCPKEQTRVTKVSCTTTLGVAAARLQVYRVADAKSVFVDTIRGESKYYRCDDQTTPVADTRQIAYSAIMNVKGTIAQTLAPSYIQAPLDLMMADASIPSDQLKRFEAAYNFANSKRMDEACNRFDELYTDYKESSALSFNVAFCHEVRGDMLRANQGYKRASELFDAPNAQIDRRLSITEKSLRENPSVFMPQTAAAARPTPDTKGMATSGRRVALVVGNARYQRSALVNPVNDARLVGDRLKRIGFDVITLENIGSARFAAAVRDFSTRAKGADIAMFYYAGHAVQADGENYLMPIDNAKIRTLEDVRDGGSVPLASVIAQLDVAAPAVKLMVVDACRDNPLPAASRSLSGGGLAAVKQAPEGGLIAFATGPGHTAEDGTGKNSVFSKHFAQQLMVPNQTIEQLFKQVRTAVKSETKNRQEPTEISSLVGDVVLVPGK